MSSSSTLFYSFTLFPILFSSISINILAPKHGSSAAFQHHPHTGSHSHGNNEANPPRPQLRQAYIALQAWKNAIHSDPNNFLSNWVGPDVCSYTGVYCAPAPYNETIQVGAGVDFNHASLTGTLPDELGLLSDLAVIHLNSNSFSGVLPNSLSKLNLLYELDLSNNRFSGPFPTVILSLPELHFLDLRFNEFQGPVPPQLFAKGLDAIILNDNNFTGSLPPAFNGNSPSVMVFTSNKFGGCVPPSIANFADSLDELHFSNNNFFGCIPPAIGHLHELRVLDMSYNNLIGPVPKSIARLVHLELLDLAHNKLSGTVPKGICALPNLANLTISYNFFSEEEGICQNLTSKGIAFDNSWNCFPGKRRQRTRNECRDMMRHKVDCSKVHCGDGIGGSAFPCPLVPLPAAAAAPVFTNAAGKCEIRM